MNSLYNRIKQSILSKINFIVEVCESIKDFKNDFPKMFKFAIISIIIAVLSVSFLVVRIPNAINCTWHSVVTQNIVSEKWRFNWLGFTYQEQCQFYNGSRWISQDKVIDVGSGDGLDELE